MDIENLFGTISYNRIEPGHYGKPASINYAIQSLSLPEEKQTGKRVSYIHPFETTKKSYEAFADFEAHSSYLASAAVDRSLEPEKFEEVKKPKDIITLEQILSLSYDTNVEVTSVNELPITKKPVKEVHFLREDEDWIYNHKVWVFKANPKETVRELTIYYIASKHGVPTGRPIGYDPLMSQETYPYDIGILGGVVEHAGDSYNQLIHNMRFRPERVHEMAQSIASIIADCHRKLTLARDEFEKYGITIERASPEKEIQNRFLFGLGIEKKQAKALIKVFEELYKQQGNLNIISHGDIHTGNIVTEEKVFVTNIKDFGLIDWDSINLDNPYGDLIDFWIHHKRQALKDCLSYGFGFEDLEEAYKNKSGRNFEMNQRDSLIQSALWNLYEMYDPVRKDEDDIKEKAMVHCKALVNDLEELGTFGYRNQVYIIKKELKRLLKDKDYLKNII